MQGCEIIRRVLRTGVVLCIVWLWSVPMPASSASMPRAPSVSHHVHTVFLIVMENHDWSSIAGNRQAQYINHTLLKMGASATRYFNPPKVHPSLPNYLWLEAGTNFGIADDGDPLAHMQRTSKHLTTLLAHANISWRAYEQGISGRSCPLSSKGSYVVRHNPMVYFNDVASRRSYCISHERPLTQLSGDLRHNRVARYNVITPDVCHDMHDSCAPLHNPVRQGDSWLSWMAPQVLHSVAYKRGGALFITWDEGEGNDGPIGMIVLSPDIRRGFRDSAYYTHSSTLRTIQEIFGVRPLLGAAARARDLRRMFRVFP